MSSSTVMVPREAIEALAREYRPSMDKDTVHDWGADAAAMLKRLAASPQPQAAGSGAAKLIAYEDTHAVAVELGYPSLTEALEALAASPQQSPTDGEGWQDISTAPKDGTLVMVGAPGCGVSLVRWMLDTWIDEQGFTQGSWPTHWRPLPAPPVPSVSGVE